MIHTIGKHTLLLTHFSLMSYKIQFHDGTAEQLNDRPRDFVPTTEPNGLRSLHYEGGIIFDGVVNNHQGVATTEACVSKARWFAELFRNSRSSLS